MPQTPTILVKEPHEVPEGGLAPFIHAGTEIGVEPERLEQRIRRAHRLIYLFTGERLIGVAAIKLPAPAYRQSIFDRAGVRECMDAHPLEFGWLFVVASERGKGHADRLIAAGREAAPDWGLFATVRTEARSLQQVFSHHGFQPLGTSYASQLGDHQLSLLATAPLRAKGD